MWKTPDKDNVAQAGVSINDTEQAFLLSPVVDDAIEGDDWEFAGWGDCTKVDDVVEDEELTDTEHQNKIHLNDEEYSYGKEDPFYVRFWRKFKGTPHDTSDHTADEHKLGQWRATAIAGNDITSSCLYVAGLATIAGGKFSPVSLLIVCIVLYFFRSVYAEVGSALPMNGGTYTVLLNTTSKSLGAIAAVLTLLSYTATGVISASTAAYYVDNGLLSLSTEEKYLFTIGVLGVFALLNLIGLSESANIALLIFIMHIGTLALIMVWGIVHIIQDHSLFVENWHYPIINRNWETDLFFGFCAGLLGVTGFETSANYIEEQKDGVFPKTLRNMWVSVTIFNPLIALGSLGCLKIGDIINDPDVSGAVLSQMGQVLAGRWLNILVSVDAVLVLSGSVLTSYVGVVGLCRRMTLDRCLPQVFIKENPITKTPYVIIIGFFGITSSLYLITEGNTETLAGVYAVSFISVMSLFAIGNMFLKYKRGQIPRSTRAHWLSAVIALAFVVAGLIGNIVYKPVIVKYFVIYFTVTLVMVFSMFLRVKLMKFVLFFVSKSFLDKYIGNWLRKVVKDVQNQSIIFFANTDDLAQLNKAILYVRDNELTSSLKIVHVYESEQLIPPRLVTNVSVLDHIYPKLKIDLVLVKGKFTPHVVAMIAKRLNIPQNFMFIACPGKSFTGNIGRFGGVRVITH